MSKYLSGYCMKNSRVKNGIVRYLSTNLLQNKNPKQILLKNTFWLFLSEGFSKLLMLIFFVLLARYLGVESYGVFTFLYALVTLFATVGDFGLNLLLIRELARNKKATQKYVENIFLMKVLFAVISVLLVVGIAFTSVKIAGNWQLLAGLITYLVISSFGDFFRSIFRAHERMQYEAASKILQSVLIFILGLLLLYQKATSAQITIAFVVGATVSLLLTAITVRRLITPFGLKYDKRVWNELFKEGWPLGLNAILFVIYFKIDTIMLGYLSSNSQVALYNTAYIIIDGLAFILIGLTLKAAFPQMVQAINKSAREAIAKIQRILYYETLGLAVVLIIIFSLSGILMNILYGNQYVGSAALLRILLFALLFMNLGTFASYTLVSLKKQKYVLYVAVWAVIINVGLNYMFIPLFHATASAYITVFTEAFSFICMQVKLNNIKRASP